jgi:hypothetical protein
MTDYSNVPTISTGDWIDAAWLNQYVGDNFRAVFQAFQAMGDIVYAISGTTLGRLPIGSNGSYLESNGSVPQWTKLYRYMGFLLNTSVGLTTGDDAVRFRIPAALNGWKIVSVAASRKSGTGIPTIQLRNVTNGYDVLSTRLTIDSGETDSMTAATPAVIDGTKNTVATGNQFAIDVDDAGTNTLFMFVEIGFARS